MKRLLVLFVIVTVSVAAFSCRSKAAAPFKLMTFNIRYGTAPDGEHHWHLRQALVYSLLKTQSPDILGVQEALNFQIDAVLAQFPDYRKIGVGRDDGDTLGEYSAILFKPRFHALESETFWFSDTPTVTGSKSWGNTITRICTWVRFADDSTGRNFYVYNLHLDHQSQPSREKSIELLLKKINCRAFSDPVVVMGDFNAGEQNPAILMLLQYQKPSGEPFFINAFRTLRPNEQQVGTFHGFSDQPGEDMIDHIFVTRDFTIKQAAILRDHPPGRYPSDHYPVMAVVELDTHK